MTIRAQVNADLDRIEQQLIVGIINAIEREALRRRAQPCRWAAFHRLMAKRLPEFRWLARAWHRARHRRFAVFCEIEREMGNPIACAYCDVD